MKKGIYDQLREALREFDIVNCAIRSKNCIYIFFQHDTDEDDEDADILFRAGFYYPMTERVWGFDGFRNVYKGKSCVIPNGPVVVVDFNGQVFSQTGETEKKSKFEFEERLPLIRQVSVMQVREIAGYAYMSGTLRTVFRRESPGKWKCLFGNDLAVRDEEKKQGRSLGFHDIDGFAADDIYACGGEGDLCHYDGRRWDVLDSPTNQDFLSLCCAGNGKVYVGGMKGTLVEGRGDEWKVVSQGGDKWIRSMAWFKDRLYLATDQGLCEYNDDRVRPAAGLSGIAIGSETASGKRIKKLMREAGASEEAIDLTNLADSSKEAILAPAALHTLSTDGELLVLGGADKVAVFDGKDWRILYAPYGINMGGSL